MVCRLVEHEQIGSRGNDDRERQSSPFTAREHRDLLLLLAVAREEELAEEILGLRPREAGHGNGTVEHRTSLVELDVVLGEVGWFDTVAETDLPVSGWR